MIRTILFQVDGPLKIESDLFKLCLGFQLFLTQRVDASRLSSVKGTCHISVSDFGDNELNDICVQVTIQLITCTTCRFTKS